MNKGLLIVGLVGVAAAGYLLLSNQSGDDLAPGGGGGGGGSKKETYSETTTSPYEQSQPIFNIEAPAPMINLVPGFDTFWNYANTNTGTKKQDSTNTKPTYETHGAPYRPAGGKKQESYIVNDPFQKPLKDTIFGGI